MKSKMPSLLFTLAAAIIFAGCEPPSIAIYTYYADLDNDGWGDKNAVKIVQIDRNDSSTAATTYEEATPEGNWSKIYGDCDDNNPDVHPKNTEVVDGIDNTCDAMIDTPRYTKLDSNGNDLAADASEWDCIRDNYRNLIWENKNSTGGLRDVKWTYTNSTAPIIDSIYDTDPVANEQFGSCYDSNDNSQPDECHTDAYVDNVNLQGLCGFNDWSLPRSSQLKGMYIYIDSSPNSYLDSDYFYINENAVDNYEAGYWSSSRNNHHNWSPAFILYFPTQLFGIVSTSLEQDLDARTCCPWGGALSESSWSDKSVRLVKEVK